MLGDEYLEPLAAHFGQVHPGKQLPIEDLRQAFAHIGFKPRLMRDLVKSLSAEGRTDVAAGMKRFVLEDRQVAGWSALLQPLDAFDRAVLTMIALGRPPMGQDTLDALAKGQGVRPTVAKVRAAIDRLRRANLVSKAFGGPTVIEDALFAEYLQSNATDLIP